MAKGFKENVQKLFPVPQRYILAVMGFLATTISFQLRLCLNITITEMIATQNNNGTDFVFYDDVDACPTDDINNFSSPAGANLKITEDDLFHWDEKTQGLILGAFFWGYVLSQIPAGILADKFGGKHILGFGILGSSIFTILTPTAARAGNAWLFATLLMKGIGEGTVHPAINALLARWIPFQERGLIGSLVFTGCEIGAVIAMLLSGYLLATYQGNWPLVFYVFGSIGVVWWPLWVILCYSEPEKHPFVTDDEKFFLRETIGSKSQGINQPPWLHIFKSLPFCAMIFAFIGRDWAFLTMLADLPKYLKEVLKFSIDSNGILLAIPFILMAVASFGSGYISDLIIKRQWLTVTAARKLFTFIAEMGTCLGLIAASYAGCNRIAVVFLFSVAMGFLGIFYTGIGVNTLDLSPNHAATLMGIANSISNLTGILAPYVAGVLTPNHTLVEWRLVFWIAVAINLVSCIIFLLGASGEIQPWDDLNSADCKKEDKREIKSISIVK